MHLRVGRVEKKAKWVLDPPHNLRLRRRRPLPPERDEEGKAQAHSRTDPHRSLPPAFVVPRPRTHRRRQKRPNQCAIAILATRFSGVTWGGKRKMLWAPPSSARRYVPT